MSETKGNSQVSPALETMLKTIVGLDIGYGNAKGTRGDQTRYQCPSLVSKVARARENQPTFKEGAVGWLVGEEARLYGQPEFQSPDSSYIKAPKYRVLGMHLFQQLGVMNPHIVTGLPVDFYDRDRADLVKVIRSWTETFPEFKPQSVEVLMQPLGTILDLTLAWDGTRERDFKNRQIPIIDIGFGTIDALEVVNMRPTVKQKGRSAAVHTVHTAVFDHIVGKYNVHGAMTVADMDEICRKGFFKYAGDEVDISREVAKAKKTLLKAVGAMISECWGNVRTKDHVVVTGGGAALLRDELSEIIPDKLLLIPENPERSIADGFAKKRIFDAVNGKL